MLTIDAPVTSTAPFTATLAFHMWNDHSKHHEVDNPVEFEFYNCLASSFSIDKYEATQTKEYLTVSSAASVTANWIHFTFSNEPWCTINRYSLKCTGPDNIEVNVDHDGVITGNG